MLSHQSFRNVTVRSDVFQAQREVLASACVLVVQGIVERVDGQVNVLAERGWRLR
ncbi:MAG: hypothetical protein GX552_04425 [Chloroflexi bacterium]|nr:hypothetical protein [Chloroflexota bacterium]